MHKKPYNFLRSVVTGLLFLGILIYSQKLFRIDYHWDFGILPGYFWQEGPGLLLKGLMNTLWISLLTILIGMILGLILTFARRSRDKILRVATVGCIEFIRGTPLLVQLYIAYFFIGTVLQLQPLTAGVASLSLFAACYFAEIFRAGIDSVAPGEILAARSLGFKEHQIYRLIILPQAFSRILPALLGQLTSIVKDSSLLSVIAITELAKAGREAVLDSFRSFEIWFVVAAIYLILNLFIFGIFYLCQIPAKTKARS